MRPVVVAAVNSATAVFLAIDSQSFILCADLVEKAPRAVDRHQRILVAVGDQRGAGDILRNAFLTKRMQIIAERLRFDVHVTKNFRKPDPNSLKFI